MEGTPIRFGTDGWRGVIADDFTFERVRRCAQGVAEFHLSRGWGDRPLAVGYDTRFASEEFARACAEVLADNGLRVLLASRPTPTPVLSFFITHAGAGGGVIITASHNPPQWNGFKYRASWGGSPPEADLRELEGCIARAEGVRALPLGEARHRGLVEEVDPSLPYREQVARLVDLRRLQEAGLTVVVDAMYGAGAGYFPSLLGGGRTQVVELHGERNPAFPGLHNPEPVPRNLEALCRRVREEKADVGLALDGDADRLGVVDEEGRVLTPLQVFSLLVYSFLEVRGERGPLVKSLVSSRMVHRLGERYGVPIVETPVGFKHIAPLMLREKALLGGEESGGYAVRGHIPERDGILSGLLFLDLMVRTGKRPSELARDLARLAGPHAYDRWDIPLDPLRAEAVRERVARAQPAALAGKRVVRRDALDGVRFTVEGDAWVVVRPSGTEPLLRLYAEADTPEEVRALLEAARSLAGV